MRFKSEIWEYWRRFEEELHLLNLRKERGAEFLPLAEGMDEAQFMRLVNTYRWMSKLINNSRVEEPVTKPSVWEFLETLEFIRIQGAELMAHAKQHRDVDLRRALRSKAKKRIECALYYMRLVEQGFFQDKEIQETG